MNQYAQQQYDQQKFLRDNQKLVATVINPQENQDKRQQVMEHLQNTIPQDDPRYNINMSSLDDPKAVDRIHAQIANQGIAEASKPPPQEKPAPQVWNTQTGQYEDKRDVPTGTAMEQLAEFQRTNNPPPEEPTPPIPEKETAQQGRLF